jgi:hypothetical protein
MFDNLVRHRAWAGTSCILSILLLPLRKIVEGEEEGAWQAPPGFGMENAAWREDPVHIMADRIFSGPQSARLPTCFPAAGPPHASPP